MQHNTKYIMRASYFIVHAFQIGFVLVSTCSCADDAAYEAALAAERDACYPFVQKLRTLDCAEPTSVNECNAKAQELKFGGRTIEEIEQSTKIMQCAAEHAFCDFNGALNFGNEPDCSLGVELA